MHLVYSEMPIGDRFIGMTLIVSVAVATVYVLSHDRDVSFRKLTRLAALGIVSAAVGLLPSYLQGQEMLSALLMERVSQWGRVYPVGLGVITGCIISAIRLCCPKKGVRSSRRLF